MFRKILFHVLGIMLASTTLSAFANPGQPNFMPSLYGDGDCMVMAKYGEPKAQRPYQHLMNIIANHSMCFMSLPIPTIHKASYPYQKPPPATRTTMAVVGLPTLSIGQRKDSWLMVQYRYSRRMTTSCTITTWGIWL